MEVEPHPEFERVKDAMEVCTSQASAWSAQVYRSAMPRYARADDMVTGAGSAKMGGRWNPPGSFRTIYASLEPETAMSESLATFRYYGWALHDAMPRLFRALDIKLSRVLDLQDPEVENQLGAWLQAIRAEDWRAQQSVSRESLSQAVGRAAFRIGLEGLLVPSFAALGHVNLAAFPDNFLAGAVLRALQ